MSVIAFHNYDARFIFRSLSLFSIHNIVSILFVDCY